MQQATANLFADMGVLPATPLRSLVFDDEPPPAADAAGYPEPTSAVVGVEEDEDGTRWVVGTAAVPEGSRCAEACIRTVF